MKRLIYLTYLGLLALILISCEQEQVNPAGANTKNESARGGACQTYSYQTKTNTINLGTAATDKILVVFNSNLTLAQRHQILRKFNRYDHIEGEFATDINNYITFVMLKPNTSCADVHAMMQSLLSNPNVQMVLPTFGSVADFTKKEFYNGIFVKMKNENSSVAIMRLAQQSNTRIVGFPVDYGPGVYYVLVDKYAAGSYFDMISFYNSSDKVEYAEPDSPLMLLRKNKSQPQVAIQTIDNK